MILITLSLPILFRRLQWQIAVALFLFEGWQRVSPFYRDFFLLPKWRACVHERNVIETRVLLFEGQRVSPFYHPSIHQISTPETTNFCHRPILSSLLSAYFQRIGGGGLARDLCHGRQRVAPFYHLSQLSHSKDSDFHSFSTPGFLMQKMTELREPLQSNSSLALTLLWLFINNFLCSFWHHFRTNCRTEMADVNKHKRWFHSSRVKFPLVSMSASSFLMSMYLICTFGSKLIRSNNQSRATLWVLETCLIFGLPHFESNSWISSFRRPIKSARACYPRHQRSRKYKAAKRVWR